MKIGARSNAGLVHSAEGTNVTLSQWLKQPGADQHEAIRLPKLAPAVGIHDSQAIAHVRTYLWALTDYHVESVQAGVIWLRPRREVQS